VRRLALILLMAGAAAACGKKGPPLPPAPPHPAGAGPVDVRQAGADIEIRVPLPTRLVDGSSIQSFRGLRLYRVERKLPPGDGPLPSVSARDFATRLPPVAALEGEEAAALAPGGSHRLTEPVPSVQAPGAGGRLLAYAVRYQIVGKRWSPPSLPATLVPGETVSAPRDFVVEPHPQGALLRWTPVAEDAATAVFRRRPGAGFPFFPMTMVAAGTARFVDPTVAVGETYEYEIRSAAGEGPRARLSAAAGPQALLVADTFPPASPRGLAVLGRPGGVDLFWIPNDEIDLAGYHVYRRRLPAGEWERMTPEPVTRTTFSDDAASPGDRYAYAVTAVDDMEPANESALSVPEEVTVPRPPPADESGEPSSTPSPGGSDEPAPASPGGASGKAAPRLLPAGGEDTSGENPA
jgi:hypothetical protein